ncbi:MAG: TetR/AcrR family transcriptional regulator [Polyangiaceae bacterium]
MTSKRPAPRTYHHGDLRRALLDAATELLREGGPENVSLRECARRIGVSHAAPYRHFPTKESLLDALAADGFRGLREAGIRGMRGIVDARDRLDAYGVAYVRFAVKHPDHFRLMFTRKVDGAAAPCGDAEDAFLLLRECVQAVLARDGEVAPGDLDSAVVAFWTLPHGLAMLILDGRIPSMHVGSAEAVTALARASFAHFRT